MFAGALVVMACSFVFRIERAGTEREEESGARLTRSEHGSPGGAERSEPRAAHRSCLRS
jgi:hypothetical protein